MEFSLKEIEEYTNNAPSYVNGLIFVQSGIEKEDIKPQVMWLRRLCQKVDGLSFMLITSNHEAKGTVQREIQRTGNVGRPKVIVKGKETDLHFHALIVNQNEDVDIEEVKKDLSHYCKSRRAKRPNLKQQKIKSAWEGGLPIVSYMLRQANEVKPYMYGSFDFLYFNDPRYCKYPDDEAETDNYDNILEL